MKTLIKNGRIVTAVDGYCADILIEGETTAGLNEGFALCLSNYFCLTMNVNKQMGINI
jgi:hypothetical protein